MPSDRPGPILRRLGPILLLLAVASRRRFLAYSFRISPPGRRAGAAAALSLRRLLPRRRGGGRAATEAPPPPADGAVPVRRRTGYVTLPYDGDEGEDIQARADRLFMGLALDEARSAAATGEVPIGAVVVREAATTAAAPPPPSPPSSPSSPSSSGRSYEVLSSGRNLVEARFDASAHAELLALRAASSRISNWRLSNCTLYSTLEPCPMCLAAAQAFRISRVVYGAPDLRLGAVETHMRLLEAARHPYHDVAEARGGVREEESAELMREFFRERRRESRERKRRAKAKGRVERDVSSERKPSSTRMVGWRSRFLRRIGRWLGRVARRRRSQ